MLAIRTHYWRPGENFVRCIVDGIKDRVEDGDVVVVSEKAISIAMGNLVDERGVHPGRIARLLARYWMRLGWGYVLGILCRLRRSTLQRFREYPIAEGSAHKQVALGYAGVLQALMCWSEGGIDASNVPYSYVSLPLKDARRIARDIRERIRSELNKNVTVMIVDTDKTYSIKNFHFTHRPNPIKGIHSFGGFIAYIIGRFFKAKRHSTPIAIVGSRIRVEDALEIAEIADRVRGSGAGRTVWDMAETLDVSITSVTWSMLDRFAHKPIVLVRPLHRHRQIPLKRICINSSP